MKIKASACLKGVIVLRINREKMLIAMLRLGINGKKLVERAGVSRSTVTAVRSGKSCSEDTARKLASVLGNDILEEVR